MKKQYGRRYLTLVILIFPLSVSAEIPLTVENLLSNKGKIRTETSFTYSNSERRGLDTVQSPITLQTGPNSFIEIPIVLGERSTNTEAVVSTFGARYGIAENSEFYGRASMLNFEQRNVGANGAANIQSDSRFVDSWFGVNYQFSDNLDDIGLLGFAEVQAAQRQTDGSTVYGKSQIIGATLYHAYDPLVLSVNTAIQFNNERILGNDRYDPGDTITITPSVGFAANDQMTLSGGVNWRNTTANKRNGVNEGIRKVSTSMDFGMTYAVNEADTLNFKIRPKVSGDENVQMTFGWSRRFLNDAGELE